MASKKSRKEKKQQIRRFLAQTPQEDYDKAISSFFRTYESSEQQPPESMDRAERKGGDASVTASVIRAVPPPVNTSVNTPVDASVSTPEPRYQRRKKRTSKAEHPRFEYLDATHSASEQKVYSILYRESKNMELGEVRVRISELMGKTGLSDKTVRTALHSLENKLSIAILERSKSPYGRLYKIYDPKYILERRKSSGLRIDPVTKQIRNLPNRSNSSKTTSVNTSVIAAETASVNTSETPSVKTPEGTSEGITEPTSVEITDVERQTPYNIKNKKTKYSKINDTSSETSSKSRKETKQDPNRADDEPYNHKTHIKTLYERYTRNSWKPADDETYEHIKGEIPDVIEAAIIASVLRCRTRVNSLAYCEGAVKEYADFLPPGYVNYLREKWREIESEKA